MPAMVLIRIGKKTIRALIRIFEGRPGPSQIISSGAMATMGTAWEAMM